MPTILIKLHNPWHTSSIDGLYLLIHNLLPVRWRQSLMKYITIISGSLIIKYAVYGYEADSLIEYAGGKLQFMRLIGIFSLYINDHAILQEDENMNFTFELALLEAVTAGHSEAVEFLLQLKIINVDHTNEDGVNAFMLACENGHTQIVELLLKEQVDPNVQDKDGWNAFMLACQNGHTQIVELLLNKQVDPHVQDKNGLNSLMAACNTDNSEIVQLLINAGADPNLQITSSIIPVMNGVTALMIASFHNQLQTVILLLKAGADPNLKTKLTGETALSKAVMMANYKIVQELIKAGASTCNTYIYSTGPMTINFTITELCMSAPLLQNFRLKFKKEDFAHFYFGNEDTFEEALQKTQDIMSNIKTEDVIETLQIILEAAPQLNNDPLSLIMATLTGCTTAVELLLKAGYDPLAVSSRHNMVNKTNLNFNALKIACVEGHSEIVRLMLQGSVDLNIIQDNVLTPLLSACIAKTGNFEIVQLLLGAGADPNVQFESSNVPILNGVTALMLASIHGHRQTIQLLLAAGSNPNLMTTNKHIYTALSLAVTSSNPAIVSELLKAGASTDPVSLVIRETTIKCTIILLCINRLLLKNIDFKTNRARETLKEIFGNDANLNEMYNEMTEILSCINIKDTIEILHLLLEAMPQPQDDSLALTIASCGGNAETVEMLLKAGYNPNTPLSSSECFQAISSLDPDMEVTSEVLKISCPSLILACVGGHVEVFQLLLKAIGDPNIRQENGETLLMIACECGQVDIVQALLENGADPNICDNKGNNALHAVLLSEESELDIVQTLKSWKLNVNKQNSDGVTPLMIASSKGYIEFILLLLGNADPNITDSKGSTALMYACKNGHYEVAAFLLMTYNADPSLTDNNGSTALCYAAKSGHNEVINVFLSNYDYNQEEIEKALTAACYGGHKKVIKALADEVNLTEYQKDIFTACITNSIALFVQANQTSHDMNLPLIESTGLTPLMLATSCGSDGIVKVLLLVFETDVNKQDNYLQYSPLLYAVLGSKSYTMVQYLLDHEADVNVISSDEQTPLDIAKYYELNDIAERLKGKGGKVYSSLMEVAIEKDESPLSTAQKVNNIHTTLTKLATNNIVNVAASVNMTLFNAPSFSPTQFLPQIPLISAC